MKKKIGQIIKASCYQAQWKLGRTRRNEEIDLIKTSKSISCASGNVAVLKHKFHSQKYGALVFHQETRLGKSWNSLTLLRWTGLLLSCPLVCLIRNCGFRTIRWVSDKLTSLVLHFHFIPFIYFKCFPHWTLLFASVYMWNWNQSLPCCIKAQRELPLLFGDVSISDFVPWTGTFSICPSTQWQGSFLLFPLDNPDPREQVDWAASFLWH